jgi:hypothetical protein
MARMSSSPGDAVESREYVLVHIVAGESLADLIAPQVIDHMRTHAR